MDAKYTYAMAGAPPATPETVAATIAYIQSKISELHQIDGKVPVMVGTQTPQWIIDQMNASGILFCIHQPIEESNGE